MVTELWARLEQPDGSVAGEDPAWVPQRQFLWEVVHDTRGLLRDESWHAELELIRTIDSATAQGGARFALDPGRVRAAYERLYARAREAGPEGPRFRLISPAKPDHWAAVQFFQEGGKEYALVGGWTGPLLRTLAPEPDQQFFTNVDTVRVGTREFRVKAVPFAEYFGQDFEALFAVLKDAEGRGLRVRFLQR